MTRFLHLSTVPPDAGTVARVRAVPARHASVLLAVVSTEDGTVGLVDPDDRPTGTGGRVLPRHVEEIAALLGQQLGEVSEPVVVAAVDPLVQLATWELLKSSDHVIAANTLDAATRVAQLLDRGVLPDAILHPPPLDIAVSVADAGVGPAATAVSDIAVHDEAPAAGGAWLRLGEGPDLDVWTGSMSREAARAVAARGGAYRRVSASASRRLAVGPSNAAGQGHEWARSVRTHATGWTARNLQIMSTSPTLVFRSDLPLNTIQWSRPEVRATLAAQLLTDATDVLVESMRPLLAVHDPSESPNAWDPRLGLADVEAIRASGRRVALVFHGSEVRRPAEHVRLVPWSPFLRPRHEALTATHERITDAVHEALADFDGPILVSTPDLLDHVPDAVWLPGVVGAASFAPTRPALERGRPVVAHAPTQSALKGTELIEPVLQDLDRRGLIRYRRLRGLASMMIPSAMTEVDVVVDQIVMGNPGVLAAQAMAAGRLVVAHLPEGVRRRMDPRPPVVEANPQTLEDVLLSILEQPDHYRRLAARGVEFARHFHDGRRSAQVLIEAFGS